MGVQFEILLREWQMLFHEAMGQIGSWEIEGCWDIISAGGEVEIAQKELADLGNRKIAADLVEKEKIVQLQQEKGGGKKDLNFRIKEMKKEIGKGDFKGLITDRSKTQEEVNTQIDVSADEFRKFGNSEESQDVEDHLYEGGGMFHRGKNW